MHLESDNSEDENFIQVNIYLIRTTFIYACMLSGILIFELGEVKKEIQQEPRRQMQCGCVYASFMGSSAT